MATCVPEPSTSITRDQRKPYPRNTASWAPHRSVPAANPRAPPLSGSTARGGAKLVRTNHVPPVRHSCQVMPSPPVILETLWGYNPINFPRSLGFHQAREDSPIPAIAQLTQRHRQPPRRPGRSTTRTRPHPQANASNAGADPEPPTSRLLEQRKPTRQTYPVITPATLASPGKSDLTQGPRGGVGVRRAGTESGDLDGVGAR